MSTERQHMHVSCSMHANLWVCVKSLWSFFVFQIFNFFLPFTVVGDGSSGCVVCQLGVPPLVIGSVWQPWVRFYSSRVCISVHTNTAKCVNAALHQLQADGSLRGLMSRLKRDWFGEGCFGENIATQMRSDAVWATAWIQPHCAFAETQRWVPDIWADMIFITLNMMTDVKFSLLTPKMKTVIYLPSCCYKYDFSLNFMKSPWRLSWQICISIYWKHHKSGPFDSCTIQYLKG